MPHCKYHCRHDALTSIASTLPCMAYQTTMFCHVMSLDFKKKWTNLQDLAELPMIYPLNYIGVNVYLVAGNSL